MTTGPIDYTNATPEVRGDLLRRETEIYGTFLGKPVDYWIELNARIDLLDADKAFALEDLIVSKVRLERELSEMKRDLRGLGSMIKRYTGESK